MFDFHFLTRYLYLFFRFVVCDFLVYIARVEYFFVLFTRVGHICFIIIYLFSPGEGSLYFLLVENFTVKNLFFLKNFVIFLVILCFLNIIQNFLFINLGYLVIIILFLVNFCYFFHN